MTYHGFFFNKSNPMGATCGAGNAYVSGHPR